MDIGLQRQDGIHSNPVPRVPFRLTRAAFVITLADGALAKLQFAIVTSVIRAASDQPSMYIGCLVNRSKVELRISMLRTTGMDPPSRAPLLE